MARGFEWWLNFCADRRGEEDYAIKDANTKLNGMVGSSRITPSRARTFFSMRSYAPTTAAAAELAIAAEALAEEKETIAQVRVFCVRWWLFVGRLLTLPVMFLKKNIHIIHLKNDV